MPVKSERRSWQSGAKQDKSVFRVHGVSFVGFMPDKLISTSDMIHDHFDF